MPGIKTCNACGSLYCEPDPCKTCADRAAAAPARKAEEERRAADSKKFVEGFGKRADEFYKEQADEDAKIEAANRK